MPPDDDRITKITFSKNDEGEVSIDFELVEREEIEWDDDDDLVLDKQT